MKRFIALLALISGIAYAAPPSIPPFKTSQANVDTLVNQAGTLGPVFTQGLDLSEIATPATPGAGKVRVYGKTDDTLYFLNSSGTESQVGSGSGEKNYITSPNTAAGWGQTSGITLATVTTSIPRLNTTKTGILFTRSSGSSAFGYYAFTLDESDYNKKLKVQFDMKPNGSYVASDQEVDVYSCTVAWSSGTCSGTSTRLPLSTDSSSLSLLPNLTGTYRTTFDSPGSAAKFIQLQLGLHAATASSAVAYSDIIVGPGTVTQGAAVSEWTSYTPTVGSFTGTVTGKWRRVGDSMQVRIYAASTTTVAGTLTIPVPTGYTIDSSKVAFSGGTYGVLGVAQAVDLGNAFYYGSVAYSTTTAVVILNIATGGGAQVDVWKAAVPFTWGNTDTLSADFTVPIAEWAGSGTVNVVQNDLTYYSAATNSAGNWVANATLTAIQGPGGSLCGTNTVAGVSSQYTITPAYPIPVGTKPVMELSGDGIHWSPAPMNNAAIIIEGLRFDGTNYFGAGVGLNATGQIIVTFGKYVGGATTAWSTANPSYWRVSVGAPGQAVGFSNVTQTASGLVTSAGQLLGTNTNDTANAGNVGELLQSKVLVASATALTTNTAKDVTTITLTAGDWDVWGWVGITGTTAVIDILTASLSTTLNTLSGADTGGNTQIVQSSAIIDPNIVDVIVATPMLPVTVANGATTTYHLVTRARFGSGTASAYGWLQARRRR